MTKNTHLLYLYDIDGKFTHAIYHKSASLTVLDHYIHVYIAIFINKNDI